MQKEQAGLLLHSDRGSQYASHVYQDLLKQHGVICSSMSRNEIEMAAKEPIEVSENTSPLHYSKILKYFEQ